MDKKKANNNIKKLLAQQALSNNVSRVEHLGDGRVEICWKKAITESVARDWVRIALPEGQHTWELKGEARKTTPKAHAKSKAVAKPKANAQPKANGKRSTSTGEETPKVPAPKRFRVNGKRPESQTPEVCAKEWLLQKAVEGMGGAWGETPDLARGNVIGEGTSSVVYLGWSRNFGQVVIKCLKQRDWAQYLKEVDLLTRLHHPNVMSLVDVDTHFELSIIMRWGGLTLSDLLQVVSNSGLGGPIRGWKDHCRQMLDAIAYLHANQVIHGDLKPGNMVVDSQRVLRLIDVGCAMVDIEGCRAPPGAAYLSPDGFLYGTLQYRSLELLLGFSTFGKPIDVWAAGAVMFELLTLASLFPCLSPRAMVEGILATASPLEEPEVNYLRALPLYREGMSPQGGHGKRALRQQLQEVATGEEASWYCQSLTLLPWKRPSAAALLRALPA